jgi:hypothetical protein
MNRTQQRQFYRDVRRAGEEVSRTLVPVVRVERVVTRTQPAKPWWTGKRDKVVTTVSRTITGYVTGPIRRKA